MLTKVGILELLQKRSKILDVDYESPEIDVIKDRILESIRNNFLVYDVDFILETYTHLGAAPNLVYDDNGRFAVSGDGFQPVVTNDELLEGEIITFVEKDMWKTTIREALRHYVFSY
jgi:hypothetical protein